MDLINLTKILVEAVVVDKENVSVKEFETESDDFLLIQVHVDEEDMGRVIGKGGKVANSIRTVVQSAASTKKLKVKINIDAY
jgi:predicted RNA-binding protein YlqC (UPF0109 family)